MTDIITDSQSSQGLDKGKNTNAKLISFNGVNAIPGPNQTIILHHGISDKRMVVRPDVAAALRHCVKFQTLTFHAEKITKEFPALKGQTQSALDTLATVNKAGFFETSQEAWSRLTERKMELRQAPARIFIITCDRPILLERLLKSLCNLSWNSHEIEGLWIIDDSRNASSVRENASVISQVTPMLEIPMTHIDQSIKQNHTKSLNQQLPDQSASIEFLLNHRFWGSAPTYGLARNWALLLSQGKRAIILDDDTIAEAILPLLPVVPTRFGTANEREAVFYESSVQMENSLSTERKNPISLMLNNVGQNLEAILSRVSSGHRSLTDVNGEMTRFYRGDSRIILGQCGSWGDPGTSSAQWLLYQPISGIRRLLASENIEALLHARSHWFGYPGTTLTSYGTLSQMTGLDNTNLLPPYIPAGRGEDILFGIILQRMYPSTPVFNEGWGIRHQPIEARNDRTALKKFRLMPGLSLLADWLGQSSALVNNFSPELSLDMIAEEISQLANLDATSRQVLISRQLLSKQSVLLQRCLDHLSNMTLVQNLPGAEKWTEFLNENRDLLMSELQISNHNLLEKMLAEDGHSLDWLQSLGHQFSQGLKDWPKICDAMTDK